LHRLREPGVAGRKHESAGREHKRSVSDESVPRKVFLAVRTTGKDGTTGRKMLTSLRAARSPLPRSTERKVYNSRQGKRIDRK
jgi:hypothetical protein